MRPASLLLPLVLCATPVRAADGGARPAYQVLAFEEDWSSLARWTGEPGRFDQIKYARLSENGSVWASFGGQVRERLEGWDGFNFGSPAGSDTDDVFLLSRIRAHADLHVGRHLRFFAEGRSALSTHTNLVARNRKLDIDEIDLQNGFVELDVDAGPLGMRLRGGREELLFGRQRLVSPLDWANTRRGFEGSTLRLSGERVAATGFWTKPVTVQKNDYNRLRNQFYGIYTTVKQLGRHNVDIYWLGLGRDGVTFNGTTGHEQRQTVGTRAAGGSGPTDAWYYDAEVAYQTGEVGSADVRAFMGSAILGIRATLAGVRPVFELGADYASGDDDPGDGDVETFNQLFPLGHAYFGFIDQVGRQNIVSTHGTAIFDLPFGITTQIDGHYFWRASDDDALYNAGGGVVRAGTLGGSNDVGAEMDLTLKRALSPHTLLTIGYSHFFPGQFIEQSGPDQHIDFGYLAFEYTI